jgi:hypothetical protein
VIRWHSIESVEPVMYNSVQEFGGWGLQWGRYGMAYNASGSEGARIRLTGGEAVLVGSHRAEELATAISKHIGGSV